MELLETVFCGFQIEWSKDLFVQNVYLSYQQDLVEGFFCFVRFIVFASFIAKDKLVNIEELQRILNFAIYLSFIIGSLILLKSTK